VVGAFRLLVPVAFMVVTEVVGELVTVVILCVVCVGVDVDCGGTVDVDVVADRVDDVDCGGSVDVDVVADKVDDDDDVVCDSDERVDVEGDAGEVDAEPGVVVIDEDAVEVNDEEVVMIVTLDDDIDEVDDDDGKVDGVNVLDDPVVVSVIIMIVCVKRDVDVDTIGELGIVVVLDSSVVVIEASLVVVAVVDIVDGKDVDADVETVAVDCVVVVIIIIEVDEVVCGCIVEEVEKAFEVMVEVVGDVEDDMTD
jgi:hypothetical protein